MSEVEPDDGNEGRRARRVATGVAALGAGILGLAKQGLLEGLGNNLGPVPIGVLIGGFLLVTAMPPFVTWFVGWLRRVLAEPGPSHPGEPVTTPAPSLLSRRGAAEPPRHPNNLPPVAGFVGRTAELDRIVGAPAARGRTRGLLQRTRAVVLAGDRGVGTSWLMRRAGHDSWDAGLLREGRVYVDLRTSPEPLTARQAMELMARLAEVGELPASTSDVQAAADLQRLLGGRGILFLLDNVDRPEQIRPILGAGCHLLVAGGPALRGRTAAEALDVGPLPLGDATDLFERAHPRLHNEQRTEYGQAVVTIARLFAGQPKALHELGGWGDRRQTAAAGLAGALLRTLDAPPYASVERLESIDAACRNHVAYCTLTEPARRMVRLLSMVDDFLPPDAIAALAGPLLARRAGASASRASALDELSAGGFLQQRGDDMRRLNPELARLARLHLHREEPEARRRRAYTRLVRHLARRASEQAERLTLATARTPAERAVAVAADEWFARHWHLLHRVVMAPSPTGAGDVVPPPWRARRAWFRLAGALRAWYERRGSEKRWRALCESVRAIAAASGMRDAEGWAHNGLGAVALRRGLWTKAIDELGAALRLRGHRGQSQALTNRGVAKLHLGRTEEALEDLTDARRHRGSADRVGRGLTDLNLGEALRRHGHPEQARHYLVEAANALEGTDDRGYAAALTNVVLVYATLGHEQDAVRAWQEALRVYDRLGDEAGAAEVRLNAAVALLSFDPPRPEQADEMLKALTDYLGDRPATPLLARSQLYAGEAAALQGRPATARFLWERSLDTAHEVVDADTAAAAKDRLDT